MTPLDQSSGCNTVVIFYVDCNGLLKYISVIPDYMPKTSIDGSLCDQCRC